MKQVFLVIIISIPFVLKAQRLNTKYLNSGFNWSVNDTIQNPEAIFNKDTLVLVKDSDFNPYRIIKRPAFDFFSENYFSIKFDIKMDSVFIKSLNNYTLRYTCSNYSGKWAYNKKSKTFIFSHYISPSYKFCGDNIDSWDFDKNFNYTLLKINKTQLVLLKNK